MQCYSYAVPLAAISRATRRANMSALPKSGVSVESRARRDDQGEILSVNARKKLGAAQDSSAGNALVDTRRCTCGTILRV